MKEDKPFPERSQTEIDIAHDITMKNQMIHKNKEKTKEKPKQYVKRDKNFIDEESGFVSAIEIFLLFFLSIVIISVTYLVVTK